MADNGHIMVVGAGPVGTLAVAALLENNIPCGWVVRNESRREELSELALQLPEASQSYAVDAGQLLASVEDIPPGSRVIVAVKAQDVDGVLTELGVIPPSDILTVCNGLRSGPTGLGLLYGGGFINSGVLVTNRENRLAAGGLSGDSASWHWAVEALDCWFLSCSISEEMQLAMWRKLAVNCVVNPLTALLDCDNGDLLGRLHGPLIGAVMRETLAVMQAELGDAADVPTKAELLLEIKAVLQATRYNSSSMREDLRHGRRTEIASINGGVAHAGERHALPCPVNEALVGMISLLCKVR